MAYTYIGGFPAQQLPFSQKTKNWRKSVVDWGDEHTLMHNNASRMTVANMQVNYDLLEGKVHKEDIKVLLNPFHIEASFIPDDIQHYSVINSKLNVLRGEESKRLFDYKAIVTNPNAISEMEEEKNRLVNEKLQQLIADTAQSEEEFNRELERVSDYFQYEYQDKREVRANRVLNHYVKEQEFPQKFNKGFVDAYTVAEEIYQCDIIGGEPTLMKLDPRKLRILRSGDSPYIEDADMVIYEEYKNPGWVVDAYWDQLSKKDIDNIMKGADATSNVYADSMGNVDATVNNPIIPLFSDWQAGDAIMSTSNLFDENYLTTLTPYDLNGNVRVMKVYWKSRRKIKKVKSYDPETGEEQFDFYPETYHCKPELGEEEQVFWINEAWEGTKIADNIYVNMRPRPVQYNRLSNPSRCHFGIIGSIYNHNGDEPFSLVDMVKPYAYLYDVYHDRLNKLLARNHGKAIRMDFAKVPKGWNVDQWLYYLTVNGIAVEDSFKEGDYGRSANVMAGALNNATNGVIDASLGNEIQQYISILEWISTKIGEILGISKQREGQISNRETVGGVERATLQSSHITEWIFLMHESVKKRVMECFLETAKIAFKGRKKKFEYILSDGSRETIEFDGDEFAECDYGIVVDNSNGAQELNQKLDMLAQAGLQNGMSFTTIMKLYGSTSLAEKQRVVENDEKKRLERQQQQQDQELQIQQQQMQQRAQIEQAKMQMEYQMHQEKLQAQILTAEINSKAESMRFAMMNHDNDEANTIEREKMAEAARQFDEKLQLDKGKLDLDKQKAKDDARIKEKQINKSNQTKR